MTHPVVKAGIDFASAGAVVSYWVGILTPPIALLATLLSLVWYGYNLYWAIKDRQKKH